MRGFDRALPEEMTLGRTSAIDVRTGVEGPTELLHQSKYTHCGVPMKPKDATMSSLYAPLSTDPDDEPTVQVYMDSVLMRCDCGFQRVVPFAELGSAGQAAPV